MEKFVIVVHAGAGEVDNLIRENEEKMKEGLEKAIQKGYEVLKAHGKAIDAVEAAVKVLEDNPLFNAGKGSAINAKGEVEMCASVMEGNTRNSGAVAIVRNVKNPVSLAKAVMTNTNHIYLGAEGALDYARKTNIELMPDAYFITEYRFEEFEKARKSEYLTMRDIAAGQIGKHGGAAMHGTVGAVALDMQGNIAAATSTGGTANSKEGRIGDSSMIGVGCFADNRTCAVSATGDGEHVIRGVIAHAISQHMYYRNSNVTEACKFVVHEMNGDVKGDIGVIAVDAEGNIGIEFNSARMLRAWKKGHHATVCRILDKE